MGLGRTFRLKRGNREKPIAAQLIAPSMVPGAKIPVDLTGVAAVRFRFCPVDRSRAPTVGTAVVTDAPNGMVRYDWGAGDTDIAGEYLAEFEVEEATGETTTYPNNGYLRVSILDKLSTS